MESGQEGFGQLIVAGGDAAELFELVEVALNAVAPAIEFLVVGQFLAARTDRRNHRLDAVVSQACADAICVIALVEGGGLQDIVGVKALVEGLKLPSVVGLTGGQM